MNERLKVTFKELGANIIDKNQVTFCVWAPYHKTVDLKLYSPEHKIYPLKKDNYGYFKGTFHSINKGATYKYILNRQDAFPDPASKCQPSGVHAPSKVIDLTFRWSNPTWKGIKLQDYLIYELHTGTFTSSSDFQGIIKTLDYLTKLGVTAIEIMPVATFPGKRNWGYDGVYPFAVQSSYGGPLAFKKLIDECHKRNLAVILDVVYNHLGPEGNYLSKFAPYFSKTYKTPWGEAINYDEKFNEHVKNLFIQNALYWIQEFSIDALRLDAIDQIIDHSKIPFLKLLSLKVKEKAKELNRYIYLFAESDENKTYVIKDLNNKGFGLDSYWNGDFHHSLHAFFTKEKRRYYQDYGTLAHIKKCLKEGFCYTGNYSKFKHQKRGDKSKNLPPQKFTVFIQNHDMIGNRLSGKRIHSLITEGEMHLSAGLVLLSPFIPLIFMGEEVATDTPFLYFTNHKDKNLNKAIYKGYCENFKDFKKNPSNPALKNSFDQSCLDIDKKIKDFEKKTLFKYYQYLIKLRKEFANLFIYSHFSQVEINKIRYKNILYLTSIVDSKKLIMIFNFSAKHEKVPNPAYKNPSIILFDSSKFEIFIEQKTILKQTYKKSLPLFTIKAKSFLVLLL